MYFSPRRLKLGRCLASGDGTDSFEAYHRVYKSTMRGSSLHGRGMVGQRQADLLKSRVIEDTAWHSRISNRT